MKILCGGFLTYRIEHPCNSERLLFLSFDYCHVLKNVRSQFLARDMGKDGEISSSHIKKIYDMQKKLDCQASKVPKQETRLSEQHRENECGESSRSTLNRCNSHVKVSERPSWALS
ncbi:unnamed protein product [Ixodes pacificus]